MKIKKRRKRKELQKGNSSVPGGRMLWKNEGTVIQAGILDDNRNNFFL